MQREAIIGLAIVITLAVLAPNQSQVEWSNDQDGKANAPGNVAHAQPAEHPDASSPAVQHQIQRHIEDASI